jgi:hypothetical protein
MYQLTFLVGEIVAFREIGTSGPVVRADSADKQGLVPL